MKRLLVSAALAITFVGGMVFSVGCGDQVDHAIPPPTPLIPPPKDLPGAVGKPHPGGEIKVKETPKAASSPGSAEGKADKAMTKP